MDPSSKFQNIKIITSLVVDESNNNQDDATAETPQSGLFVTPSTVTGRTADVTGFLITAENSYGKLEFSDPDGFISLDELSDVVITAEATNNVLTYNGTNWVNVDDVTLDSAILTKVNVAQATNITTAVTITGGSNAGTITTQAASAVANASHTFRVNNANVNATSIVQIGLVNYVGAGIPYPTVGEINTGFFDIIIYNVDSVAALDDEMDISYLVF